MKRYLVNYLNDKKIINSYFHVFLNTSKVNVDSIFLYFIAIYMTRNKSLKHPKTKFVLCFVMPNNK